MSGAVLRRATRDDLPALLEITNQAIEATTANWSRHPTTLEERAAWLARIEAQDMAAFVAEADGHVLGFGAYAPFHAKDGYDRSVEHSVYVRPEAQGQGLGRRLLEAVIAHATARGMHAMVGLVAAEAQASIALHLACGFAERGRLPQMGHKFGRWLDLVHMHRLLG